MFEIKFNMIVFLCIATAIYVAGVITAQYRLFPYHEIRSVKNFIVGDISVNANASRQNKTDPYYNRNKYYRKKSFFEAFPPNANIIMFGDSNTDIAEWYIIFPAEKIANYGISGDTTAGAFDRIQQIDTLNNLKVFIMLGINDLLKGEEVGDVFYNYKKIVEHFIAGNASVYIQSTLFISEIKSKQHEISNINQKVSRLNTMLERIADENEKVTYIDINAALSDKSYLDVKYTIKGRFLNGEGYRVWSNVIRPHIVSDS